MSYPTDIALRRIERASIRRRILAEAELRIARTGRSMTCGEYGRHETSPGGTTCVGAKGCLCECHDPKEADA